MIKRVLAHPIGNLAVAATLTVILLVSIISVLPKLH